MTPLRAVTPLATSRYVYSRPRGLRWVRKRQSILSASVLVIWSTVSLAPGIGWARLSRDALVAIASSVPSLFAYCKTNHVIHLQQLTE